MVISPTSSWIRWCMQVYAWCMEETLSVAIRYKTPAALRAIQHKLILAVPEPYASHSCLPEPYASEHARFWVDWPQHLFMCHQLPYMAKQLSTSYTGHIRITTFSFIKIAHCVKRPEKGPNLLNQSRRLIRTTWPLLECITTFPSNWRQRETVVCMVGLEWLAGTAFDWPRQSTKTRHKRLWPPLQAQLLSCE